jgi:core-2/I-Branching enzyme
VGLAYVVLAHKLPRQLARLLERLDHPDDVALVHVDAKKPIEPFRRELEPLLRSGRVRFTRERVRCHWGGPGHLRATLAAAEELLDSGHGFSHMVLLTGQDYPIRPLEEIREFFAEHEGESFLSWSLGEGRDVPDSERAGNERWRWHGRLDRLKRRHYELPRRKRPVSLPNRFIPWVPERSLPEGLVPAQGLAYWALSRGALAYAVDYAQRRPDVARFFRRALAADENYFQMVLLSSPLSGGLVNEDLRYLVWDEWHPRTLTRQDLEPMLASRKLFARKFDETVDSDVLDALDSLSAPAGQRR